MAKRLFVFALVAAAIACQSKKGTGPKDTSGGMEMPKPGYDPRDPVERALLSLGIEGAVQRMDLNAPRDISMRVARVAVLRDLVVAESDDASPSVIGVERSSFTPQWYSNLSERTSFPVTETGDNLLFVSEHFLTALEKDTGRSALRFIGGPLDGVPVKHIRLPFTPTASATGQHDTAYVANLGSPDSNKNLEAFSLVTGQRGWGFRSPGGAIFVAPEVGGSSGDPKLYVATASGLIHCMDATNYGRPPRRSRWEETLDGRVMHEFFLTDDTKDRVGALYIADDRGTVYCLDRITGNRRWTHVSGRIPSGPPRVFGNLCVVPMTTGLSGYAAGSALFRLSVTSGPDRGAVFTVRAGKEYTLGRGARSTIRISDPAAAEVHLTLKIDGEVLTVGAASEAGFRMDGVATERGSAYGGTVITLGGTRIEVEDNAQAPLFRDLEYDEIVARIGEKLVARNGNRLSVLDAGNGEVLVDGVEIPGARIVPANTFDGKLYVLAGDGVLYTLFPR